MLAFFPCLDISSIAPLERYVLGFICLQGGGLYISGTATATLTNTNVYSNTATNVLAFRTFPDNFSILGLTLA